MYGVSTAEDLVSDLVNNGIIKESELEALAEVFDKWCNKILYSEMVKEGVNREEIV